MKQLLIIIISFTAQFIIAQNCNGPNHSINVNDSWLSCTLSQSPNLTRGNSHWIMYDLGYEYQIGSTHIWNYNVSGETERGMKTITIDYSSDANVWLELSSWELEEASGGMSYEGQTGPNFGGIKCRYILITSNESWGGDCTGLSEVRFDIMQTVGAKNQRVISHDIQLFPNPTSEFISIHSEMELEEFVIISTSGTEMYRGDFQQMIDISYLPQGMFFIQLTDNTGKLYSKAFTKL